MGAADVGSAFSRKLSLEQGAQRAVEKIMQTTELANVQGTIASEVAVQADVDVSQVNVTFPRYCGTRKMPDVARDEDGFARRTGAASEREAHYSGTGTEGYDPRFRPGHGNEVDNALPLIASRMVPNTKPILATKRGATSSNGVALPALIILIWGCSSLAWSTAQFGSQPSLGEGALSRRCTPARPSGHQGRDGKRGLRIGPANSRPWSPTFRAGYKDLGLRYPTTNLLPSRADDTVNKSKRVWWRDGSRALRYGRHGGCGTGGRRKR